MNRKSIGMSLSAAQNCYTTCNAAVFDTTGVCQLDTSCEAGSPSTVCATAATHNGVVGQPSLQLAWQAPASWPAGETHVTFLIAPIVLQLEVYILREWTTLPIAVVPTPSPSTSPSPASTPAGTPAATPASSPGASPASTPEGTPMGTPAASPAGSPASTPSGTPSVSPSGAATPSQASTPSTSASPPPLTCADTSCGSRARCVEPFAGTPVSCLCATGWAGPACDRCAAGFALSEGQCQVRGQPNVRRSALVRLRVGNFPSTVLTRRLQGASVSPVQRLVQTLQVHVGSHGTVQVLKWDENGAQEWLQLIVAAADMGELVEAVDIVTVQASDHSSATHQLLRQEGLAVDVDSGTCASSFCLRSGSASIDTLVVSQAFSGLAWADLQGTQDLAPGLTLRSGVFAPPGPLSGCAQWPPGAAWSRVTSEEAARQEGTLALVLEMRRATAEAWLGLAFPPPGSEAMLGATAIIGQPGQDMLPSTAAASVGLTTGAAHCSDTLSAVLSSLGAGVATHSMTAKTSLGVRAASTQLGVIGGVIGTASLPVPGMQGEGTLLRVALLVNGPSQGSGGDPGTSLLPGGKLSLLWAAGQDGTTSLAAHDSSNRGSVTVQVYEPVPEAPASDAALLRVHGAILAVSWLILAPLAMLFTLLRTTGCLHEAGSTFDLQGGGAAPCWLKAHAALHCLAVLGTIVGTAIGFVATARHFSGAHAGLGLAACLLHLAAVAVALFRPKRVSRLIGAQPAGTDAEALQGEYTGRSRVMSVFSAPPNTPGKGISAKTTKRETAKQRADESHRLHAAQAAHDAAVRRRSVWEIGHRLLAVTLVCLFTAAGLTGLLASPDQEQLRVAGMVAWCVAVGALLVAAAYRFWAVDAYGAEGTMVVGVKGGVEGSGASTTRLHSRASILGNLGGTGRAQRTQGTSNPMHAAQGSARAVSPRASLGTSQRKSLAAFAPRRGSFLVGETVQHSRRQSHAR